MINHLSKDAWIFSLLGDPQFQRQKGFLAWWYRLTSPPEIDNPTLEQRDLARRAKILSALALFLALILVFVAVIAFTGPNKVIINTVYILYPTLALCLLLNRFGYINVAGLLLIVALVGGMDLTLTTTAFLHGGLSPNDKDILYLSFFGELVAAALLPASAIFLVAALNISVSLMFLYAAPHTPAFDALLASGAASSIVFRIVEIHIFTSLVCWIVANITLITVKKANRAEELIRLEHDLHVATAAKLREKEQFEQGIREIARVHVEVANGNLGARASLGGGHVLWQIAGPLNNLLNRHQHAVHQAQEREWCFHVLNRLMAQRPSLRQEVIACLKEMQAARRASSPGGTIPTTPLLFEQAKG